MRTWRPPFTRRRPPAPDADVLPHMRGMPRAAPLPTRVRLRTWDATEGRAGRAGRAGAEEAGRRVP
jgi:hypothetical protein